MCGRKTGQKHDNSHDSNTDHIGVPRPHDLESHNDQQRSRQVRRNSRAHPTPHSTINKPIDGRDQHEREPSGHSVKVVDDDTPCQPSKEPRRLHVLPLQSEGYACGSQFWAGTNHS